jgi:hypothetical protein
MGFYFFRDFLSKNDFIGDVTLDMSKILEDGFNNDRNIKWTKQYHSQFIGKLDKKSTVQFEDDTKMWLPIKSQDPTTVH